MFKQLSLLYIFYFFRRFPYKDIVSTTINHPDFGQNVVESFSEFLNSFETKPHDYMLCVNFIDSAKIRLQLRCKVESLELLKDAPPNFLSSKDKEDFMEFEYPYYNRISQRAALSMPIKHDLKYQCFNFSNGDCRFSLEECHYWHAYQGCLNIQDNTNVLSPPALDTSFASSALSESNFLMSCRWWHAKQLVLPFHEVWNDASQGVLLQYWFYAMCHHERGILMAPKNHYDNDAAVSKIKLWNDLATFLNWFVDYFNKARECKSSQTSKLSKQSPLSIHDIFETVLLKLGGWEDGGCGEGGHAHLQIGLSVKAAEEIDHLDDAVFQPLHGRGLPVDDLSSTEYERAMHSTGLSFTEKLVKVESDVDTLKSQLNGLAKQMNDGFESVNQSLELIKVLLGVRNASVSTTVAASHEALPSTAATASNATRDSTAAAASNAARDHR